MTRSWRTSMISFDTETTGVDLYHGAKPYLVTIARENGEQAWWEWYVDPLTREPIVPDGDIEEIQAELDSNELVLQNAKFDVAAWKTLGDHEWPWENTKDTLLAAHLLNSGLPHDLGALAVQWLGVDIQPFEDTMQKSCNEARRLTRTKKFIEDHGEWMIADKSLKCMPSAKDKVWKYDTWLPRAIAKACDYPADHPWHTVTRDYANTDSAVTLAVWKVQREELLRLDLWEIYLERLKVLPVAHKMESKGVTVNRERLHKLRDEYCTESEEAGQRCINIAEKFNYDLQLPKGSSNGSLRGFVFDVLQLPAVRTSKKTGDPSFDKFALDIYEATLEPRSLAASFIRNLRDKRSRDTAISYMESYERFWIPLGIFNKKGEQLWFRLHPSLNPTGTATLRWSSSNPNEQNISKKKGFNLRYGFGPAPGREWWTLDAENIELRIPAYKCGEAEQIALFERPKDPPFYGSNHMLIFSILWPDLWNDALKRFGQTKVAAFCKEEYESNYYQWTKNGNFAVQYGATDRDDGLGTADRAYHQPGAQAKIKARFKKLAALNDWCIKFANKHGYIETLPDKTVNPRRGYPLMCTRTEWGDIKPTVPLNYMVQGTACWWMGKAMTRCDEYLTKVIAEDSLGRGYYMNLQVHDELAFDFPQGRTSKPWMEHLPKIKRIKALMEQGGNDIGIPTSVSIKYHSSSWSEGVKL